MDATFRDDLAFLRKHTDVIVLSDEQGTAQVALAPVLQGRVMTSTAEGDSGRSLGWINRERIASGQARPHINVFGGEDRFWMGPEGGQYSIFFAKGAPFDLAHWFVPEALDKWPFQTLSHTRERAQFAADFALTNYSDTRFEVHIEREIRLLSRESAWQSLGLPALPNIALIAFESNNKLVNAGWKPWRKETGLLSIWIAGMFKASPAATIVVPIQPGPQSELGVAVTSDYFGAVPADRLKVTENTVLLRADANFRSKIGINPKRSCGKLGSYDTRQRVLTLVQFTQPPGVHDYVSSLWKLQDDPYSGDASNGYNDGPPAPGATPFGPFYELETSSPAAALAPGGSLNHTHRTIHLTGPESGLDTVARAVLGVSVTQIATALPLK